jgi:pilus assembly protein CpaE
VTIMTKAGMDELPKWRTLRRSAAAEILLSADAMARSGVIGRELAGFDLRMTMLDTAAPVPAEIVRDAQLLVLEVRRDQPASVERLKTLVKASDRPVVAAVDNLCIEGARELLRAGASDVLPLPLTAAEVEAALDRVRGDLESAARRHAPKGRIVAVVKSVGGVGATALLTQLACLYATEEGKAGREVCLIDLDIQFGSAALYLGALPKLGLKDLIEAGGRADGALLRATTARHASGLHYVAAPPDVLPLDAVDPDQVMAILDLAAREFGTVFIDLPTNWTDWSLSALARADLVLLVAELSVASLHQARRQLDLVHQQNLEDLPLHIVMNRVERRLFQPLDLKDAERTLAAPVAYVVANDSGTMRTALDQGVPLSEINSRSRASRDLAVLADGIRTLVGAG